MNISVNAEITESKNGNPWVLYDGDCRLCIKTIDRLRPLLRRHNFGIAPLQTPWVCERLGVSADAPPTEMALLTPEGLRYGGADAILKSAEYIWWARPFARLAVMLGLRPILHVVYRYIAARRHCWNGACELPSARSRRCEPAGATDVNPPVHTGGYRRMATLLAFLLPILAIFLTANSNRPRWVVMWATAFSIWFACKWLTVWQARYIWSRTSTFRVIAYFFAWPGMNARTFLDQTQTPRTQSEFAPLLPVARIVTGITLIWFLARLAAGTSPVVVGWIGMLGMVLILHFGLFDLLAWLWQRANVEAPRLMNRPMRSTSVGEFWGRRWNLAFHELAQAFVFRPSRARFGTRVAICAVFIASGLIHELVISLPARGGYGLPTAYFAFQAAALLFERTEVGRRLGLGESWRGWLYTIAAAALPAFWLFHPQFLKTVILPFMDAIGAL